MILILILAKCITNRIYIKQTTSEQAHVAFIREKDFKSRLSSKIRYFISLRNIFRPTTISLQ